MLCYYDFDRPHRLVWSRTPGFHPGNTGSNPVGVTNFPRARTVRRAKSSSRSPHLTMVVLSSHTKFIPIDQNHNVLGCITTLSGQVLEAITKETSVGKSLSPDNDFDDTDYLDETIIDAAYETIISGGFLRSLMIPRFLDVLVKTGWHERKLFVEAAIATEDLRALDRFDALKFPKDAQYILCGPKKRCSMFKYLLNKASKTKKEIITISDTEKIDMLSIKGSVYLAKQANLI